MQHLPLPSDGYLLSLGCATPADDFVVFIVCTMWLPWGDQRKNSVGFSIRTHIPQAGDKGMMSWPIKSILSGTTQLCIFWWRDWTRVLRDSKTASPDTLLNEDFRWPILYHFSPDGTLCWLDWCCRGSNVLEIGSGWGAITGCLCERAQHVTALIFLWSKSNQ